MLFWYAAASQLGNGAGQIDCVIPPMDLGIVLDRSQSINVDEWLLVLGFVRSVVDAVNVSSDGVRYFADFAN